MNLNTDTTTPPNFRRVLIFLSLLVAGLLAAHALDLVVYRLFHNHDAALNGLPKMFRGAGYLPLWIVVASALICIDTAKWSTHGWSAALQRGVPIILTVILSGVITEGVKCLIHRGRPPEFDWSLLVE